MLGLLICGIIFGFMTGFITAYKVDKYLTLHAIECKEQRRLLDIKIQECDKKLNECNKYLTLLKTNLK